MADLKNLYHFVWMFDVENGNPNGDPDNGNNPRVDDDGHGIVSDVCLKRKIRNRVYDEAVARGAIGKNDIFVRDNCGKTTNDVLDAEVKACGGKLDATRKALCDHYYDVRTFGQVASTGLGKGTKTVQGPVQLYFARSVDEIAVKDMCITKCVATTTKEGGDGETGRMGEKHYTPYGLYVCKGQVTPKFAGDTGFSEDDLETLWNAMVNAFELDRSAGRGLMSSRKLVVFKHDSEMGNWPAWKIYDLVKVAKKDGVEEPKSFDDYDVTLGEAPENVEVKKIL